MGDYPLGGLNQILNQGMSNDLSGLAQQRAVGSLGSSQALFYQQAMYRRELMPPIAPEQKEVAPKTLRAELQQETDNWLKDVA